MDGRVVWCGRTREDLTACIEGLKDIRSRVALSEIDHWVLDTAELALAEICKHIDMYQSIEGLRGTHY